jgi:hypothetical protein
VSIIFQFWPLDRREVLEANRSAGLAADDTIQPLDGRLVTVGLDVAVGVGGLADVRVAELSLHPPDVRAALQQPGREGVPCGVIRAVGKLASADQGLPDLLEEEG